MSYCYITNPAFGIYESEDRHYSSVGSLTSPTKRTGGFWCPECLFNKGKFTWIVGTCRVCKEWFDEDDPIVTFLMSVR